MSALRCPACGVSLFPAPQVEVDPGFTHLICGACGEQPSVASATNAGLRSTAEQLAFALRNVRWDRDPTSRNPHYHDAVRTTRLRLRRAADAAVKELP